MEKEMFENTPEEGTSKDRSKGILWGVLIALAIGNVFAIWQSSQTQSQIRALNSVVETRMANMNQQTTSLSSRADRNAALLKSEVEQAQQAAAAAADAANLAKKQAEKKAQQLVQQLADEYKTQQNSLVDELGNVRNSATQANQDLVAVKTDVHGVRGDVDQTRSDLEQTQAELKSTRGDLGVQSGLIATNAKELAALRELGERTYHEFTIQKDKEFHKVGNISVVLKNTSPKRGRYTLDVVADDQRVEKKNRTVNEPVQFYVSGARQPYELVINQVDKNQVTGYLAVPKVLRAAR